MVERQWAKFFNSPAGIGLAILGVSLVALLFLWLAMRAFNQLLNPVPYIVE